MPLPQHSIHFTTRLLWLLSSTTRATSSFHLHLLLPRGFVWRVYFSPPHSDQKYLLDDQAEGGNTRITLLTLEPLAHSLLAPRRDRLHARSPATVAPSVPSRPSRLLPLWAAGGGKNWRWLGIEQWRIVLPPTGTGKSRPAVSQWRGVVSLGRQQRPLPHPYTHHPPPSPEGVLLVLNNFLHSSMRNKVNGSARLQEQRVKAEGVRPGNTCTW